MFPIECHSPLQMEELLSVTEHPEDLDSVEVFLSAVNIQIFSDNTTTATGNPMVVYKLAPSHPLKFYSLFSVGLCV